MTSATMTTAAIAPTTAQHPPGALAQALQEAFTVATRLRTTRQAAPDAGSFRSRVKQLLTLADDEARREGYAPDSVRLAVYAYIAFLDESVLNSGLPIFMEWPRQPLQEEIFGDHMAGETFFRHLQELLGRQDSAELADVLEVFLLCMLLGFRGKYGTGGQGGVEPLIAAAREKIARIRGPVGELSPSWRPPADVIAPPRDAWTRRLVVLAVTLLVLALVLFIVFKLVLHGGVTDLRALGTGMVATAAGRAPQSGR
jgi:type VI secretion system protein ImpK